MPFVPAAAGPPGPVTLGGLLGGVQTGALPIALDVVLAAVAAGYLTGVRRLRRRGRPWSTRSAQCFIAGLVVVALALCGGIARYDDTSFPVHMTQHVLLMMVAPPLFVLGRPVRLLAQSGSRRLQRRVVRIANSGPARLLTGPLAWVVYFGTMWGYLLSPWYAASLSSAGVHEATHAAFLLVGLCYWESIIGGDGRRLVPPVVRGLGLMLSVPFESALGLILMVRTRPVPGSSLAVTHAGGQLFWMEAMTVMGVALFATLWLWARDDEQRRAARREGPAATLAAPASAADHLLEEATWVLRGGVADPGDMLIRPDEDEP